MNMAQAEEIYASRLRESARADKERVARFIGRAALGGAGRGSGRAAILKHIRDNPGSTVDEIVDRTNKGRPNVYKHAYKLFRDGQVTREIPPGEQAYRYSIVED